MTLLLHWFGISKLISLSTVPSSSPDAAGADSKTQVVYRSGSIWPHAMMGEALLTWLTLVSGMGVTLIALTDRLCLLKDRRLESHQPNRSMCWQTKVDWGLTEVLSATSTWLLLETGHILIIISSHVPRASSLKVSASIFYSPPFWCLHCIQATLYGKSRYNHGPQKHAVFVLLVTEINSCTLIAFSVAELTLSNSRLLSLCGIEYG